MKYDKIIKQLKRETEWAKDYEAKKENLYLEQLHKDCKKQYEKEELRRREAQYWYARGMRVTYEDILRFIENKEKEEA